MRLAIRKFSLAPAITICLSCITPPNKGKSWKNPKEKICWWPLSCLLTNTWGIQSFGPEPGEVLKPGDEVMLNLRKKPSPCSHYWWFSFKGDKTLQCIYFKNHADAFDQAVSWYRPFYWVCGSNSSKVQGFPEISLPLWADVTAKSLYFYKDKVLLQFHITEGIGSESDPLIVQDESVLEEQAADQQVLITLTSRCLFSLIKSLTVNCLGLYTGATVHD